MILNDQSRRVTRGTRRFRRTVPRAEANLLPAELLSVAKVAELSGRRVEACRDPVFSHDRGQLQSQRWARASSTHVVARCELRGDVELRSSVSVGAEARHTVQAVLRYELMSLPVTPPNE